MMIPNVQVPEGTRGKWSVTKFEVISEPSIESLRLAMSGRACRPGNYTRLDCEGRGVIMSDTTAEKNDHWSFVLNAKGHCLINGLGLGMCVGAALLKDNVDFVTVIEMERDVIDLVWPTYEGQRCEVIHTNALEYRPEKGMRFGAVWHDIWDSICEDNREEMKSLHRKYGRLSDWQGSWGRDTLDRLKRKERRYYW